MDKILATIIMLLILLISIFLNNVVYADGIYVHGGVFAYDDIEATPDYSGMSPNGSYSIYLKHNIDDVLSVDIGWKHSSSMAYKEAGDGFNGLFLDVDFKLWGW